MAKLEQQNPSLQILFNGLKPTEWRQFEQINDLLDYCKNDLQRTIADPDGDSVTAINRTAVSHINIMETAVGILSGPRFSEKQRDAFFSECMPEWLATPYDIEKDLLPMARKYGLVQSIDELREMFHLNESNRTVNLFSYLQIIRDRVRTANANLRGQNLEQAVLHPTLSSEEHSAIGLLLLNTIRATPDNNSRLSQARVMIPTLLAQNISFLRKSVLMTLPRISQINISPAEKRKAVIRNIEYLAIIDVFGDEICDILGDPDDSRHDIARAIVERYDEVSDFMFRDMLISRVLDDDLHGQKFSVIRIKNLMQVAEDLDDSWYKDLADGIVQVVRTELPFRLYYLQELEDFVSEISMKDQESTLTINDCEAYIESHMDSFRNTARTDIVTNFFTHQLSAETIRLCGMDPINTQIRVLNAKYPPENFKSGWIVHIMYRASDQDLATEVKCAVTKDEIGFLVWVDMVDRETDHGSEFEQQIIRILQRGIEDACSINSKNVESIQAGAKSEHPVQIIQSIGPKGLARQLPKETKRTRDDQSQDVAKTDLLNSESSEGNRRFDLKLNQKIMRSKGDSELFQQAVQRYLEGPRHMKIIIADVCGPHGGRIFRLRAGFYRLMFEQLDETHAELIDIILRKDLETWIKNHL